MKVKFGLTTWDMLEQIARDIRLGQSNGARISIYRKEVQEKLMDGLAAAINAEIQRVEMEGEQLGGHVTFEIDLKIERIFAPEEARVKRNLLVELEALLDRKPAKKLLGW